MEREFEADRSDRKKTFYLGVGLRVKAGTTRQDEATTRDVDDSMEANPENDEVPF
jgi:hypothetical protein